MARVALGIEYDGGLFAGWQTQPDGRGVQDALERALAQIAGTPVATVCAGRTDAGVHASQQVVHFDAGVPRPLQAWVRGVNTFLPPTVAVRWAHPVPDDFHARYAARGRRYAYLLRNEPVRSPLWAGRAGWVFRPLDLEAMQVAATVLVGRHDFSSFRSAQCQAASPVRDLRRLEIGRDGRLVTVQLEANAFLHHMVRNIVGCLVAIGTGRHPPAWLAEVLAARARSQAAPTFAADGLYLVGVDYDPLLGLPGPLEPALPCDVPASRSAD